MFSKTDIEKYFLAEKNLGLLFMIIGMVAVIAAIVFFFVMKTSWHKGVALPFIIIGLVQLAFGFNVFKTSDKQRMSAMDAYDMNPAILKGKELPRMEKVMNTFKTVMIAEVVLFLAGIFLFVYCKNDPQKIFWAGVGIALAIQAAVCLFADITAFTRATVYRKGLTEFLK